MADLLSGTRALRGRAALELRVRPFGYRDARDYWGIADPAAAFAHNALAGGTPGYREPVPDPQVPENPAQLGGWLARNVLRPSMPLSDEARIACREHKTGHEIDFLALAPGGRPRTPGTPVAFVGAAKHRDRRPGPAGLRGLRHLRHLRHLRDLLTAAGHDASDAVVGLFSTAGFTDDLAAEAAASRGKILLATLGEVYGQQS
jgi:hypothetical protein